MTKAIHMKTVNQIIDTIEFGKCKQEIEISFQYDNESTDNVVVWQHNYDDGKHIISRKVTELYTLAMLDAMVESVDIEQLRIDEMASKFDDKFSNEKGESVFEQVADICKPNVNPLMANILALHGIK
jgi:hypothetical protein